jgi:acyl-CoA dehydrogenase
MLAEHRRQFLLTFFVAELFGAAECDDDPAADKLLRLLTPVVKLYTAKQAIRIVSEALEGLGGAGYMEDLGMAKHYRDVQTLSIWEGTTNVLSLDMLRAVQKEDVLPAWFAWAGDAGIERLKRFDLT